jgi:hypothetical protein
VLCELLDQITHVSLIVLTVARTAAIKAVKQRMQAQGIKLAYIECSEIARTAMAYLRDHPELIEHGAETIAGVPALRRLAEREARDHASRANVSSDAQSRKPCSTSTTPVHISRTKWRAE